jgi:hypothetical protein
MPITDNVGNLCTHRVTLHVRTVVRPFVIENDAVRCAQKAFGPHGICIDVRSTQRVAQGRADLKTVRAVGKVGDIPQQQQDLFALGTDGVPNTEVLVYFVSTISTPISGEVSGCAGHRPERPAVLVAQVTSRWTMAHEVGHILLEANGLDNHSPSWDNLMFPVTSAIDASPPYLTKAQVALMKASRFCIPC